MVNLRELSEDWQRSRRCLTRCFAVPVERRVVGEMAIFATHQHLLRPLLTTPSAHPLHPDLPDLPVIRPYSPTTRSSFCPLQRPIHPTPLPPSTPDQSCNALLLTISTIIIVSCDVTL